MSSRDAPSIVDLELVNARERARSQLFGMTPPTTRLDRFSLLEQLGAGGMGVVFAAYDPELDRRVALKLLRTEPSMTGDTEQGAARLQREAQAMARVSHPNVITVYEVGRVEGQVFIAMEYVAGQTLERWLGAATRQLPEILAVFEQAGRGLAAAHAAGLVHRDFKPTNVMVGDDGRVRVLDFGLARPSGLAPTEPGSTLEPDAETDAHKLLGAPLTQTGAVMGTPAYMAPEQLDGSADAQTDQFAFCVALYEALFGQVPFDGNSAMTRAIAIQAGQIREPPTDRKVPRTVHMAITRGLEADPSARHPSLEALLAAIRPRPRRRRWWVAGIAGAAAAAIIPAVLLSSAAASPCADAAAPMREVWNEARAARLAASFDRTGAPFAAPVWSSVAPRLDHYADGWAAQRVSACEATQVHGTQSESLLDRRMACLEDRRRELEALLEVWSHADPEAVASATKAVSSLPQLARCEDVEALLEGIDPPAPEVAARVERARGRLAELRAQERAGRYQASLPRAIEADEQAKTTAYSPLQAEAALVRGRLMIYTGDYRGAGAVLQRAYELGMAHRHDDVAIEAATRVALALGYHLADHDLGAQWVRHASALLERTGGAGEAHRLILRTQALLNLAQGEFEPALERQEQVLRLSLDAHGESHHETGMAHYNLGLVLTKLGRGREATEHHEQARRTFEAVGGPRHPDVAYPLQGLADEALRDGRLDQAQAMLERARELREQALGPEDFALASTLSQLAIIATRQQRLEDAAVLINRAVAITEARFGPDHMQTGRVLINLGHLRSTEGKLEESLAINGRVISSFERSLRPEHPLLLHALRNRAAITYQLGNTEEAVAELMALLPRREHALGREHPRVAGLLDDIGIGLVELGRAAAAIPRHERALAIYEASHGAEHLSVATTLAYLCEALLDAGEHPRAIETAERLLALEGTVPAPQALADGRFLLAMAHWAAGHQELARQGAREAEAAYAALGEGFAERVAEVQRWRRAH